MYYKEDIPVVEIPDESQKHPLEPHKEKKIVMHAYIQGAQKLRFGVRTWRLRISEEDFLV